MNKYAKQIFVCIVPTNIYLNEKYANSMLTICENIP